MPYWEPFWFGFLCLFFYTTVFNSLGCLAVLCAHDNSLSLWWSLHPPVWDINKGLVGASVWKRRSSFEPNRSPLIQYLGLKSVPVAGEVGDFVLVNRGWNWVLDEVYRSSLGQHGILFSGKLSDWE